MVNTTSSDNIGSSLRYQVIDVIPPTLRFADRLKSVSRLERLEKGQKSKPVSREDMISKYPLTGGSYNSKMPNMTYNTPQYLQFRPLIDNYGIEPSRPVIKSNLGEKNLRFVNGRSTRDALMLRENRTNLGKKIADRKVYFNRY